MECMICQNGISDYELQSCRQNDRLHDRCNLCGQCERKVMDIMKPEEVLDAICNKCHAPIIRLLFGESGKVYGKKEYTDKTLTICKTCHAATGCEAKSSRGSAYDAKETHHCGFCPNFVSYWDEYLAIKKKATEAYEKMQEENVRTADDSYAMREAIKYDESEVGRVAHLESLTPIELEIDDERTIVFESEMYDDVDTLIMIKWAGIERLMRWHHLAHRTEKFPLSHQQLIMSKLGEIEDEMLKLCANLPATPLITDEAYKSAEAERPELVAKMIGGCDAEKAEVREEQKAKRLVELKRQKKQEIRERRLAEETLDRCIVTVCGTDTKLKGSIVNRCDYLFAKLRDKIPLTGFEKVLETAYEIGVKEGAENSRAWLAILKARGELCDEEVL